MFVWLSKVLDLALEPLWWALALLAAAALLRRRARLAVALALLGAAVLAAFSSPAVANALYAYAERPARTTARGDVVYDAVIVLAGGPDTELNRLLPALGRVRAGNARFLVVSGGVAPHARDPEPAAAFLAREAIADGVPPARVIQEPRSRNTHENAVETARIVRERGWTRILLVTAALHMPRALACFRAEGLTPDALPAAPHGASALGGRWAPRAEALTASTEVIRELAGRVVYALAGYAD